MNLKELDSFKLADAIKFHDELNPKLWMGTRLRPEVKKQLKIIAEDFLEELGVSGLDVKDITVSGSNAAYTYTPHSDLDLHILVDMNELPNNEVYKELFNAKKTLYNDSHDITLKGVPVELYVQDSNEPVVSLGEYSILNDKWLKLPVKRRANLDQTAASSKYKKLFDVVQTALKTKDSVKIDKTLKKIKQYRKAGLDKNGEFGPENLAFKAIRSQGLLTKLYALRDKLHSEKLSIESMYAQNEDYHPNATPPGPEFKPTMPKGTVRVDVSDVYDWYKLGQHISNMKGLGKHDFGKGPPSTILSFGDEDLEHQYINALKNTGLDTTDIDPKAHDTKKGQKVDPTYNVNENELEKNKISLNQLYDGDFPDRDELFWDHVRSNELKIPLQIRTLPKHKLQILLLSQYRVEHIDELFDIMDTDQKKIIKRYMNDPVLSDKIIVLSGDMIIDGNHRAFAAAKKGTSINYVDLADLEDEELNETFDQSDQIMYELTRLTPAVTNDPAAGKVERIKEIIQRTPADSTDWQSTKTDKAVADLKMVPGNSQYGYVIKTLKDRERVNLTGTDLAIYFYDTKAPDGILNVGYISFRNVNFPPAKKAIQVSNVVLDSRYRGQGLGIMMYTTMMQLGYVVVADETQTPQARKLWVNLNQTPGVEVRGRIEIMRGDIDAENASEWTQAKVKANIKKLKNIGATMQGKLDDYVFNDFVPLDFPVKSDKTGAELAARGIKLYSTRRPEDMTEDYSVSLYARWIG